MPAIWNYSWKTDYVSPNPKQPFSQAEDGEQFCCRGGDCFRRFSGIVRLSNEESLSDVVNDSKDYSGEPAKAISTLICNQTEKLTEWLCFLIMQVK